MRLSAGNSLTEVCYTTPLQTLIEKDPKLSGVPLRYAAMSKLCELRIRAVQFLDTMSEEEVDTCTQTRHVRLEDRLRHHATLPHFHNV